MADRRGTRLNLFYGQTAQTESGHKPFQFYRGTAPLSRVLPSEGGTSLSAGTIQITTGLKTIYDFHMALSHASVAAAVKRYVPVIVGWKRGYKTAGGATVTLAGVSSDGARVALTPGLANKVAYSGATIYWLAIGVGT